MKNYHLLFLTVLVLLLSACSTQQPSPEVATPTVEAELDPCAPENVASSVRKINELQREFDDASQLASNVAREQLPAMVSNMQRIRRAAEDQETPACLSTLKKHQLNHMNTVINTMIAFVGGADQQILNDGIAKARQEHDLYALEIARLLGITLAPTTTSAPPPTQTPDTPTPAFTATP